jgi:hypothetical protein
VPLAVPQGVTHCFLTGVLSTRIVSVQNGVEDRFANHEVDAEQEECGKDDSGGHVARLRADRGARSRFGPPLTVLARPPDQMPASRSACLRE